MTSLSLFKCIDVNSGRGENRLQNHQIFFEANQPAIATQVAGRENQSTALGSCALRSHEDMTVWLQISFPFRSFDISVRPTTLNKTENKDSKWNYHLQTNEPQFAIPKSSIYIQLQRAMNNIESIVISNYYFCTHFTLFKSNVTMLIVQYSAPKLTDSFPHSHTRTHAKIPNKMIHCIWQQNFDIDFDFDLS